MIPSLITLHIHVRCVNPMIFCESKRLMQSIFNLTLSHPYLFKNNYTCTVHNMECRLYCKYRKRYQLSSSYNVNYKYITILIKCIVHIAIKLLELIQTS